MLIDSELPMGDGDSELGMSTVSQPSNGISSDSRSVRLI